MLVLEQHGESPYPLILLAHNHERATNYFLKLILGSNPKILEICCWLFWLCLGGMVEILEVLL